MSARIQTNRAHLCKNSATLNAQ